MAWHAPHEGRSGRPPVFSNAALQFCLSVKVLFKPPLRQTAGMVASLLRLAGLDWPVSDDSMLCRRQKTLKVQIPQGDDICTLTADGACDTRRCHSAVLSRGGTAIIPIRKNGRPWKEDCPTAMARNKTLRARRHYGRAFWKRLTGYHARSRVEAKMRCLKSFGERIAARDPDRQTAEIHIRVALINRFNALGTAESVRVA